jgi:hypothetical protein
MQFITKNAPSYQRGCYTTRVFFKVIMSSSCLWASFHGVPSLGKVRQVRKFLLNLGMKCWNPAFSGTRFDVIVVALHVGAVKIYVATMEVLRKKERWVKTSVVRLSHFRLILWIPIEYIYYFFKKKDLYFKKIWNLLHHPDTYYFTFRKKIPIMNMSIFNFHKTMNLHKIYVYQFYDFITYPNNLESMCVMCPQVEGPSDRIQTTAQGK